MARAEQGTIRIAMRIAGKLRFENS